MLPRRMILFGKPEEDDLVQTVNKAIDLMRTKQVYSHTFHDEVRQMYSWGDVARRTELVYLSMLKSEPRPLIERMKRYYGCGVWAGKLFCVIVAIDYLLGLLLDWLQPRNRIDSVPAFHMDEYRRLYDTLPQE